MRHLWGFYMKKQYILYLKFKYKRPDDVFKAYGAPVPWADHKDGCRFPVEPSNMPCNAECRGIYCYAHSKICGVRYDG